MLISEQYKKQNQMLHASPRGFGASGHRWDVEVALIVTMFGIKSWLDYGCGQSTLIKAFSKRYPYPFQDIKYREYDPAVPGKDKCPEGKFDLVTCTDVLEHVEPLYLSDVLDDIYSRATKFVFFNINLKEANKVLNDGRNAHLIIQNSKWWIDEIRKHTGWIITEKTSDRPWKDLNLWTHR